MDLAIPRNEEPRKKIGSHVEPTTWKSMRNKVINLLANLFQTISKFTSKSTRRKPPRASRDCIRSPPRGGAMGPWGQRVVLAPGTSGLQLRSASRSFGCHRNHGRSQAHGTPCWGGNTLARGSRGESGFIPPFPPYGRGVPPRMAPRQRFS